MADDIESYINYLTGEGWAVTQQDGNRSAGTVQLSTESVNTGKIILLTMQYGGNKITLTVMKGEGTLNRK